MIKMENLITEIGTQKLDYVEYENIPELVRNAIIATEDSRFFEHHGIDPIRLGGAVIANFTSGFGVRRSEYNHSTSS